MVKYKKTIQFRKAKYYNKVNDITRRCRGLFGSINYDRRRYIDRPI